MKNTLPSRLQLASNGSPFAIRLAMSLLTLASFSTSASAATLTWAGGASNTWNSTSSWSPGQIPVNGDDLIFNTASATATNNFANNALTLNSITFSASGQTLGQSTTNGINLGAGGVTAGNNTGTSAMVLGVTLTANQTWSVGTTSTVTLNRGFAMGNNTLTKTGAGTLRFTGTTGSALAGSQILVQNGSIEVLYSGQLQSTTAIVMGGTNNTSQLRIVDGNNANRLTNLQSAISIAAGTTGAVTINNSVLSSASDVTLSGNISLGTSTDADLVFNTTTGSVTKLTGAISGSMTNANSRGNILFSGGNGEVQFLNASNSFSGVRSYGIQQGVVVLGANDPANGSSNGALGNSTTAINVGTSASPNAGVASLLLDGAIATGRNIIVGNAANNNTATYTLGGRTAHDSVFSGGITLNRDVQLTAANGGNVTFSGILNDAANTQSVTKVGNGTAILTRANTYDGSTTISAGALTTSNATALGSTTGGTTVSSGAALQLVGGIAIGAEALSLTGDGISSGGALRNLSGTNSYAGAITLAGATRINSDADTLTLGAGGISGTQNLSFGGAGNTTVSGVIGTGASTLTKDGAGTLTLSGNNTYDGSTTISVGALTASNAGALGSTTGNTSVASGAALQLSGGIAIGAEALSLTGDGISSGGALRNLSGTNSYAGAVTLAGATRINSDAGTLTLGAGGISGTQNLTFGGAGNINVNGIIGTSSGTLTKDGNGILTLGNGTGTSYTGATTVNAGTLVLSGAAYDNKTSSSSALTIATGATLNATNSGSSYSHLGSLAGNGTLNVGTAGSTNRMFVGYNNSNTTFSGTLNLANSNSFLFKVGTGVMTLSGNNTGSIGQLKFATTSNAVNEMVFANAAAPGSMLLGFDVLGTLSASVAGVDIKGGISFNNNGNFGSAANTNDILVSGGVDLGTATRTITVNNNTTFAGIVTGNQTNSVGFTKSGAGILTLSGNNTYKGLTTVNAGALNVASTGSLASGNAFTLGANATANLANAGQTLGAVINANSSSSALNFSATTGTVTLASLSGTGNTRFGNDAVITGGISTGTVNTIGSLTANITGGTVGAGSLTAGTVNGGTTTVGGVATIGTMSAGSVNLNGVTSAITTLNGGSIALGNSTTLSVSSGSSSGVISGGGSLNKTGGDMLTLTANNTYTGNTTVSNGTLAINGSVAGAVAVNSGATLQGAGTIGGALSVSGQLSPGNSIESIGASSVSFLNGSTYAYELNSSVLSGDLLYTTGVLSIASATTLSLTELATGTLAMNGKLTLISYGTWNGGLFTYNGNTLNNGDKFTLGSNEWLFKYDDTTAGSNFLSDQDGASRYITMTVVPEPNVAMVVGSLALMTLLRRRRD